MDIHVILGLSILLQFAAAFAALRLIPVTGRRRAWILISTAICLMAVRRCFALYREISQPDLAMGSLDLATEWVALATSALMLAGIRYIAPLFLSMKHTIEALRVSEERYRTLFEDSSDTIYISSREGKFIDVNPSGVRLFGFERGEMIGMDVHRIYVNPTDRAVFQEEIEKTGAVRDYEMVFKRKDGTQMDCMLTATVHRADDGTVQGYRGIIRDCTELKRTMAMLDEERQRLFSLLNDLPGLVSLRAPDHTILYANRRFRDHYGDPQGRRCYQILRRREAPCEVCPVFRVLETKSIQTYEYRSHDGMSYHICHYPFTDVNGDMLVLELAIDITDRKEAEQKLKASETRYRSLVENMSDGIYLVSPELSLVFHNPAMEKIFGRGRDFFMVDYPQAFLSCVHPEDRSMVRDAFFSGKNSRNPLELTCRIVRPDGEIRYLRDLMHVLDGSDGDLSGYQGIISDVTEIKRTEEALRESESKFRCLAETAPCGIVVFQGSRFNYINPQISAMTGYSEAAMMSGHFWDVVHPDFRELVKERELARQRGETVPSQYEFKIVTRDGREKWLVGDVSFILFEGRPAGVATVIDITDRKAMEEALHESEARYRELVQNANSIILRLDTEGNIAFFNEYAQSFFGYAQEEVLGRSMVGSIIPATETAAHDFETMLQDMTVHPDRYLGYEQEHVRRNGEPVWIVWTSKAIVDKDGRLTGILCIGNDITRNKQLETQSQLAQRLESIGRLAGGIAHDFNNLLTIILGYTDFMLGQFGQYAAMRGPLDEIKGATERGASLVRQLLAFSRKQLLQPKVINLNVVITDTEKMLRRLIGEDIELVAMLDPSLGFVKADPAQIEQIILNLAINARDAMPQGGRLTIETANADLDEAYAMKHVSVQPGPYVMFAVSDTGVGMDTETLAHIFDPFFTTKEEGKGTGLGLAGVYGTVKQSGGCIWVYSEPERGTTFRIYLPRIQSSIESADEAAVAVEALHGSETILFVEDEDKLREIACRNLRECGYTVLEASRGDEALRLHEQHEGPIHLLVTDVVMPAMSGRELAERVGPSRSDMKVLYISGYTENAFVHHGVLDKGVEFLQKPFTPTTLLARVREVLKE